MLLDAMTEKPGRNEAADAVDVIQPGLEMKGGQTLQSPGGGSGPAWRAGLVVLCHGVSPGSEVSQLA